MRPIGTNFLFDFILPQYRLIWKWFLIKILHLRSRSRGVAMEKQQNSFLCTDPTTYGMRLDRYLFMRFPQYSRAYFQHLIDQGCVLINDRIATKSNYSIKPNDHINITFQTKECNLTPTPLNFELIDEQNDFVVVNKPAGLLVHHAPSAPEEVALVNGLLYQFQELSGCKEKVRPGIVHRLDRDTSGILLVARNDEAQRVLSSMFKLRQMHKTYLAVVQGHPPKEGVIDYSIGRHPTERHKMSVIGIDARPALTMYQTIAYYRDSALVAARIITGRTHQIRVHFAAIGHGLLGDETYGHKSAHIDRQALHAWKFSFTYKEKSYSYECLLPDDMKKLIQSVNTAKNS